MNKVDKKTIIINDIAATSAGAYTILENFLEELVSTSSAHKFNWVIFVSTDKLTKYERENVSVININSKNWITRIYWDLIGLSKWIKKKKINVYRVFSIQNTGLPFLNIKQYIYIHQPLILGRNIRLKPFEWKIMLFRFIYYYCVKWTIKKGSTIIVQTEWMKKELCHQFKLSEDDILIIKPKLKLEVNDIPKADNHVTYKLFYPAVPVVSYKNHELLIKALYELNKLNSGLFNKIQMLFTADQDFNKLTSYYCSLIKKLGVDSNVKWCGYLNREQMNENYIKSDLFLFPSQLESFGLPLIEAAYNNCIIYTLNTSFARELLKNYSKVKYLDNNPLLWAKAIDDFYKNGMEDEGKNRFSVMYEQDRSIISILMN